MNHSIVLPFINVRDLVIFPKMIQCLYIGRKPTINAIQYSLRNSQKRILVLTQKRGETNAPEKARDMYAVGTICSVEGSIMLQDKTMKARLAGEQLFAVTRIFEKDGVRFAQGRYLKSARQTKRLSEDERLGLLELLVRAKPLAALNDDADWFTKLKEIKRSDQFVEMLQMNLHYKSSVLASPSKKNIFKGAPSSGEIREVNTKIRFQQKILEEMNVEKKIGLLREYLKCQIREATVNL